MTISTDAIGHAFGVRVQKVQKVQREVVAADAASFKGGDEFYSFPSVLHTGARPSAQYNDVGGHPYRHFDRSEAEWRNLTPQWARKRARLRRGLFRRVVEKGS